MDRAGKVTLHTGGVADTATGAPARLDDRMRVASVAKAFSGATALSLVAARRLSLDTTIGERLPGLPRAWWPVTLAQLLGHTSAIPDFSASTAFGDALRALAPEGAIARRHVALRVRRRCCLSTSTRTACPA